MQTVQTPVLRPLTTVLSVDLFSMFAFAGAAQASVIFSDNFEPPTDVTVADDGATAGAPAGWTVTTATNGALYGIQNPNTLHTYTGTTGSPGTIANMDGPQVVYVYADNLGTTPGGGVATFSHTLANTLVLGDTYTADISVGHRGTQNTARVSLGYFFELWAGSTLLASASSNGSSLPNDTFTVISFSHLAIGSDPIGQPLQIRFGTNVPTPTSQMATDFDAVSLTETTPEPASLALAALASVGLLRRRRA